MRRLSLALILGVAVRTASGQGISARDSTTLLDAIVADFRTSLKGAATGQFVLDTTVFARGPISRRIANALVRTDTTSVPTRTTPRIAFSEPAIRGDTATVSITVRGCREGPVISFWSGSHTHRYYRRGDRWVSDPMRSVIAGDGMGCPW